MTGKAKLSKNILQMKFMQRSVLRMEEEQNEEEKQRVIDDEHWVLDLPQLAQREDTFVMQPSYTACEQLMYGRMSFKGFNPEVEKLMAIHNKQFEEQASEEREKEQSVSEIEMTDRYSTLVGIISKKFNSKKRRADQQNRADDDDEDDDEDGLIETPVPTKKKRTFLKPEED